METRRSPSGRGSRDIVVAAGFDPCLHPLAVWGTPCVGGCLTLAPNTRQHEWIESGIQCRAVSWVCMKHGVMVPSVDVGVGMVDVMNIWVTACALVVQAVGPAIRKGSCRWEAGLGKHVAGPQSSILLVEWNRAGGKAWVDWNRNSGDTGAALGWISVVPSWASLTFSERATIWNNHIAKT